MLRTLLLLLCFFPSLVYAFADDLCFNTESGVLTNCVEVDEACGPPNTHKICKTQAAKDAIESASLTEHPRSMLHTDATFYMAQAVGIPYDSAHRIAAYDQAIDLGDYVPLDAHGKPIIDPSLCHTNTPPDECKYVAKPLNGLVRMNLATGGTFFHYGALNNPKNLPINGLNPFKNDPVIETMLTNLRTWIFTNNFLCTAGLNGFQIGTCYLKSNGQPGQIDGVVPVLESDEQLDLQFTITIQEQVLHKDDTTTIYARDLANYVGANEADDVKMGIFMHTLQDRISHHKCIDGTSLSTPATSSNENFISHYPRDMCHQSIHLLWHGWEIGRDQSTVPEADRTVYPSLDLSYDELLHYAKRKGWAQLRSHDAKYKQEVLSAIYTALQIPDPEKRLNGLMEAMDSFGFKRLPGH